MNLLQSFFLWFKHDSYALIIDHETVAFKEQLFSGEIKGVVVSADLTGFIEIRKSI